MHTTNYSNVLIEPAEDCKNVAKVPGKEGSVAAMQYELIADHPYERTSDDVISRVAARRKNVAPSDHAAFVAEFFSKGQPCFRASPLTKTHGWAIHSDQHGRVALLDPTGAQFAKLAKDPNVSLVKAMRNKRA